MKNILYFLAFLVLVSCNNRPENAIQLTAEITNNIEGGMVKIEKIINDELIVVDSIQMGLDNKFEKFIVISEPAFYRLNIFDKQYVNIILNETDVSVVADGNKPNGSSVVTGSIDTDYITDLSKVNGAFQAEVQKLNQNFMAARNSGDVSQIPILQNTYLEMKAANDELVKDKIRNMENSIAAILSLQFLNADSDFEFFDEIATKFNTNVPNSSYTKGIVAEVEKMRKLAVGSPAPEISLPDPDGNIITLSSFKGKYVMVDFWAAWCRPCRQENPNVVRMYNTYNSKGFEVLGVSFDRKKDAWVKAIADDKLNWTQVSDLKYFQSAAAVTYNITGIPATYLVGPDGKIIAKGLRGPQLEAKLKEIFG
jgi:peroxiredoxin